MTMSPGSRPSPIRLRLGHSRPTSKIARPSTTRKRDIGVSSIATSCNVRRALVLFDPLPASARAVILECRRFSQQLLVRIQNEVRLLLPFPHLPPRETDP